MASKNSKAKGMSAEAGTLLVGGILLVIVVLLIVGVGKLVVNHRVAECIKTCELFGQEYNDYASTYSENYCYCFEDNEINCIKQRTGGTC